MNKKDTVPILYPGGGYGSYLVWCLIVLTTELAIKSPLNTNGNSHKFKDGNYLHGGIEGWRNYLQSADQWNFIRFHPKMKQSDSLRHYLNELSTQVNFFVYIRPSTNTLLLTINNQFTKMHHNWWDHSFQVGDINSDIIYNNWPVSRDMPISQTPNWIKREFLSYYMMPWFFDEIEWHQPEHYNQSNCLLVFVEDILYNFKNTISKIINQSTLTLTKSLDDLVPHHSHMISLQKNIDQDFLCRKIIDSIVDQKVFDWTGQYMPLPSEAYVQWELRNQGFELRCHGLDILPTNSVQLKELLYTV